jgi:hypothetical protein
MHIHIHDLDVGISTSCQSPEGEREGTRLYPFTVDLEPYPLSSFCTCLSDYLHLALVIFLDVFRLDIQNGVGN